MSTQHSEGEIVYTEKNAPMDWDVLYDFAGALKALNRGYQVARQSWKNPGKYVFLWSMEETWDPELGRTVPVKPFLMWKNDKGDFVPWTPSQDAILATDWHIGVSGSWTGTERPKGVAPAKSDWRKHLDGVRVHVIISHAGLELITYDHQRAKERYEELSSLAAYQVNRDQLFMVTEVPENPGAADTSR